MNLSRTTNDDAYSIERMDPCARQKARCTSRRWVDATSEDCRHRCGFLEARFHFLRGGGSGCSLRQSAGRLHALRCRQPLIRMKWRQGEMLRAPRSRVSHASVPSSVRTADATAGRAMGRSCSLCRLERRSLGDSRQVSVRTRLGQPRRWALARIPNHAGRGAGSG